MAGPTVDKLLGSGDALTQQLAAGVLKKMDVKVGRTVPQILASIEQSYKLEETLKAHRQRHPDLYPEKERHSEFMLQLQASQLGYYGSNDPSAVQALVKLLTGHEEKTKQAAAESLGQIGEFAASAAMPALVKLAEAGDELTRLSAAEALLRMGKTAAPAGAQAMAKIIADGQRETKWAALKALEKLHEKAAPVVPALIALLESGDELTQQAAALALSTEFIEEHTAPAVPALVKLLDSNDAVTRRLAARALTNVGRTDVVALAPAVPALVQLLSSPDQETRKHATQALRNTGAHAAPAVPDLVKLFGSDDRGIKSSAAQVLGKIGPPAREIFPALVRASLKDARNYMNTALALTEPASRSAWLGVMLQIKPEADPGHKSSMQQAMELIVSERVFAEDPTFFMITFLKLEPETTAKAKAWLIYQTAGDDNLRWLYSQLKADAESLAADPRERAARGGVLKEILDKARANKDAKDLFPEALLKLLLALESLTSQVGP